MWAHQLFFSNMDYSLKVNALIVSFLIVNFLINSFLKENFLSVMPWCFQSHNWQWHGAPQCSHMLCEKAAEPGFLGVPSLFVSPPKKHLLKWKKLSGVELQLESRNSPFFHCPGAQVVLLQFKVTFQQLWIIFFFPLLGFFSSLYHFSISSCRTRTGRLYLDCHHVLVKWLVGGIRAIMQFVFIMPLQKSRQFEGRLKLWTIH